MQALNHFCSVSTRGLSVCQGEICLNALLFDVYFNAVCIQTLKRRLVNESKFVKLAQCKSWPWGLVYKSESMEWIFIEWISFSQLWAVSSTWRSKAAYLTILTLLDHWECRILLLAWNKRTVLSDKENNGEQYHILKIFRAGFIQISSFGVHFWNWILCFNWLSLLGERKDPSK